MSTSHSKSERRPGYWVGLLLAVAGFLTFGSVFVSAVLELDQLGPEAETGRTLLVRMVAGMLLMIAGSMLMRMGLHGGGAELDLLDREDERDEIG